MDDEQATGLIAIIGIIATIIIAPIIRGLVLVVLWGWFILPLFPKFPELTIPYAIGLSITMNFLISTPNPTKTDEDASLWESIKALLKMVFVVPLIALGIAWIVTLFI